MLSECKKSLPRAIEGDPDETQKLFRACAPRLRERIAARIPKSMQSLVDADDVLQETFAEAFVEIRTCQAKSDGTFFAWLRTIADHNLADLQRSLFANRRDVRRTHSAADLEEPLERLALELTSSFESPSLAARRTELGEQLRAALWDLPDAYRSVIVLYDLHQVPVETAAEQLGCSVGSIYMRRQRAHRVLRGILKSFSRYA